MFGFSGNRNKVNNTKVSKPNPYQTIENTTRERYGSDLQKMIGGLTRLFVQDPVLKNFINKDTLRSIRDFIKMDPEDLFHQDAEHPDTYHHVEYEFPLVDLKINPSKALQLADISDLDNEYEMDEKYDNIYDDAMERINRKCRCLGTDTGTYQVIDVENFPGVSITSGEDDNGNTLTIMISSYVNEN